MSTPAFVIMSTVSTIWTLRKYMKIKTKRTIIIISNQSIYHAPQIMKTLIIKGNKNIDNLLYNQTQSWQLAKRIVTFWLCYTTMSRNLRQWDVKYLLFRVAGPLSIYLANVYTLLSQRERQYSCCLKCFNPGHAYSLENYGKYLNCYSLLWSIT